MDQDPGKVACGFSKQPVPGRAESLFQQTGNPG